jgi:transglutaminase-like putative cysteine protease
LIIIVILIFKVLFAQDFPAEILNYNISVEVSDTDRFSYIVYKKMKVNNSDAKKYLTEKVFYNQITTVKKLEVKIIDNNGKLVRRIKKGEILDQTSIEYLYEDERVKIIDPYHNRFPFYIEYEYTLESKSLFVLPSWYPRQYSDIPVWYSSYELSIPSEFEINYKFYNFEPNEDVTTEGSTKTFKWEIIFPDKIKESAGFSPKSWRMPRLEIVPKTFNFGGIEGGFRSWTQFGNWMSELIDGLDELPGSEITLVKELTDSLNTELEKTKVLYKYLQASTRYINVSIGIGGLKPYNAAYVCKNAYGDCKALTNYMKALLKAAGIESKYALVNGGENEIRVDTSFVNQQFNHVILCVPLEQDTVWLECTSQDCPFNYVSSFIENKYALICDFEKSKLVKTTLSGHKQNYVYGNTNIYINGDSIIAENNRRLGGVENEELRYYINNYSHHDFEYWMPYISPIEDGIVHDFNHSLKDDEPIVNEFLKVDIHNQVIKYNEYLQIDPLYTYVDVNPKWYDYDPEEIFISHNCTYTDTVNYILPLDYRPESLPKTDSINSLFGEFIQECEFSENKIQLIKSLKMNQSIYGKDHFNDYLSFLSKVNKLESQKIVLIREDE